MPHQASKFLIDTISEKIKINYKNVIFRKYGNTNQILPITLL